MRALIGTSPTGAMGSRAGRPRSFGGTGEQTVELTAFHPHFASILSAFSRDPYANGQADDEVPAGAGRCPVPGRGPRPSVHRAGAPHGGTAGSTGRHGSGAAGEGGG